MGKAAIIYIDRQIDAFQCRNTVSNQDPLSMSLERLNLDGAVDLLDHQLSMGDAMGAEATVMYIEDNWLNDTNPTTVYEQIADQTVMGRVAAIFAERRDQLRELGIPFALSYEMDPEQKTAPTISDRLKKRLHLLPLKKCKETSTLLNRCLHGGPEEKHCNLENVNQRNCKK